MIDLQKSFYSATLNLEKKAKDLISLKTGIPHIHKIITHYQKFFFDRILFLFFLNIFLLHLYNFLVSTLYNNN